MAFYLGNELIGFTQNKAPARTTSQLNVNANGTYTAEDLAGYSPVVVNVPAPSSTSLSVTSNGTYTASDAGGYSPVVVNVPTPTISELTVTSNGTYTASGSGGYSPVIVNVTGSSANLIPYAIRPDAELIQTYSYDQKVVEDLNITLPVTYSTTSTTLIATAGLSPTIAVNFTDYNYYCVQQILLIPEYNSNITNGAGKQEFSLSTGVCELIQIPGSTVQSLDKTVTYSNAHLGTSISTFTRVFYRNSSGLTLYGSTGRGIAASLYAPTYADTWKNSTTLTVNSPAILMAGHSSVLSQTYYEGISDIRVQYKILVYREPKNNLNIDGWGLQQQILHIIDCVQNNSGTLT